MTEYDWLVVIDQILLLKVYLYIWEKEEGMFATKSE